MPTHVHGELRKALKQFKDAQSTQEEKDATENIVIAIDGLIESKVAELLRVGRERKGRGDEGDSNLPSRAATAISRSLRLLPADRPPNAFTWSS